MSGATAQACLHSEAVVLPRHEAWHIPGASVPATVVVHQGLYLVPADAGCVEPQPACEPPGAAAAGAQSAATARRCPALLRR